MARKKHSTGQKQGPPIQFRPGVELEQLVITFAAGCSLPANEACKVLVALAVSEMDCRHYPLIAQLAEVIGGANAFPRACNHVHVSLQGARRMAQRPLQADPGRTLFIVQTVRDYIANKGLALEERDLWYWREDLPQDEDPEEEQGVSQPQRHQHEA